MLSPDLNIPFVRNPYNYDTMQASDDAGLHCPEPTLTVQTDKDDCDINIMLSRMARGIYPEVGNQPQYMDVTDSPADYHTAMQLVVNARNHFNTLDSKVQKFFGYDPIAFMEFCSDPDNSEQARKLGLTSVTEDLSRGAAQRSQEAGAAAPVGKSLKKPSASVSASKAVFDDGGETGEF